MPARIGAAACSFPAPGARSRWRVGALLAVASLFAVTVFFGLHRQSPAMPAAAGFETSPATEKSQNLRKNSGPIVRADGQFMTLDPTGRFVVNSITKKPVFITGDAAWTLMTQLDDSDVQVYLSDRAGRGFNFIECGAADNYYQSNPPKNADGVAPFDGPDFTHEDPKYWAHIDSVLHRAAGFGITVALNPGFVGLTSTGGYLTSYQNSSSEVMRAYGAFLGDRYRSFPNIVWALGGDVDPNTGVVPKLTALAEGIRSKDSVHLMAAEGKPQAAALDTFAGTTWMDLNWLYFHTENILTGAPYNFTRVPFLPPFLGEAWYEHTNGLNELQLRSQGYWAVLGGSYLGNGGFGNSPIWYFNGGPDAKAGEPSWKHELGSPGSLGQMYLGRLFRSREHWKLVPDLDHSVMTAGYDSRGPLSSVRESIRSYIYRAAYRVGDQSSVAARTDDGQTIIAYVLTGNATTITIDMSKVLDPGFRARCWWFNPRDGSSSYIGAAAATGSRKFTPPDHNDWVLIIDGWAANLPAPGSADL